MAKVVKNEYPPPPGQIISVLPSNNLDVSETFYNRLGFNRPSEEKKGKGEEDSFRMLANGQGGYLMLCQAMEDFLIPGKNPNGLYLYTEKVDDMAAEFSVKERLGGNWSPHLDSVRTHRVIIRRS